MLLQFRERARAEVTKHLPDAVQQPDFRLPACLIEPGLMQQPVSQFVSILTCFFRGSAEQVPKINIGRSYRHVWSAVRDLHASMGFGKIRCGAQGVYKLE